jgi:hypothetical protein
MISYFFKQNYLGKLNILVATQTIFNLLQWQPVPVASRSKAWACGRSLGGFVGSNPAGGMDA